MKVRFSESDLGNDGRFKQFYRFVSDKHKQGEVLLVYRGESIRRLSCRLKSTDSQALFERLFMVGEKARHFFADQREGDELSYLRTIDDCSVRTLEFIFDRLAYLVAMQDQRWKSRVLAHTSETFRNFFLNSANRRIFVRRIRSAKTPDILMKARDYYLYFLHAAGSAGVTKETFLVSTTTNLTVAKYFARKWTKDYVVFHYFVPQPFHEHAIAPWVAFDHQQIIKTLDLPAFQPLGLFPGQSEVSVKGALFPQFILGVEVVRGNERTFVRNPHAASLDERQYETVLRSGIPVDQTNFTMYIEDTSYRRWVYRDADGEYEDKDVERNGTSA